jgi:hypothetical protein
MEIKVTSIPITEIGVAVAGPEGKSSYQLWLDAGNSGTLDDFFKSIVNRNTKVYRYDNQTEMVIMHQIGKRAMVQCIEDGGALYEADIVHLNLDTVQIKTKSQKILTIIIQ